MIKRSIALFLPVLLLAQEADLESLFLETLNEASDIASNERLNIDKTPSTVVVLRKDFIEKSGAWTLFDLLCYIPGIETSMTSSGKRQIIIRGAKNSYRDKIKFLINGTEVTNSLYTNQFYYYNFPASLIKRVEFTRTPDAIRYGNNAFLGVINIVTLDEENPNSLQFALSKDNNQATLFWHKKIDSYYLQFDAHTYSSQPKIYAPPTLLIDLQEHAVIPFRQSVEANTLEKNRGIGIKLQKDEWTAKYRYEYYKKGNFFGISRVAPLEHDQFIHFHHQFFDLGYKKFLTPDLKLQTNIGYKYYIWHGAFRTFPYDLQPTDDPSKDLIMGAHIAEETLYAKAELKYFVADHNILFHIDGKYANLDDVYYIQYVPALGATKTALNLGPNATPLRGDENLLPEDTYRRSIGIAVEDLWSINDSFSVVGGMRFDHFSDFGDNYSHKAGVVYHINDQHTLKLLHNKAFRAPSWVELYAQSAAEFNGNKDLKAEKIQMNELQWLWRPSSDQSFKLTSYIGKSTDTIDRAIDPQTGLRIYKNLGDFDIKGFEASFDKIFGNHHLNLTYSQNFDKRKYKKSPLDLNEITGTRKRIFYGYVLSSWQNWSLFSFIHYGSSIQTPSYIDDIPSSFCLNETLSYQSSSGVSFEFGVKNLTNERNCRFGPPSELIADRYMFVPQNGAIPNTGRKFFFMIRKRL